MEANDILTADVLDIIFNERNKEYGAYDLRKSYQRRLVKSVAITFSLMALTCVTYVVLGSIKHDTTKLLAGPDVVLEAAPPPPDKPIEPPPPPPPPPPPVAAVKMLAFTSPPMIVKEARPEEMPPPVEDLQTSIIGTANIAGADADDIIGPPVDINKAVVETPQKRDDDNNGFVPVEVDAQYPGGLPAWSAFLNRNLSYPQAASDNQVQGTVMIQFVVDAEGNVSEVIPISGPEELRPAAVTVIKKSGKWTPALQNGRHVKSHKRQPVTFRLEGDQ